MPEQTRFNKSTLLLHLLVPFQTKEDSRAVGQADGKVPALALAVHGAMDGGLGVEGEGLQVLPLLPSSTPFLIRPAQQVEVN